MALPAAKPDSRVSLAEYLRREETATDRHEYHDGEILAMSGCTVWHGRLNLNLSVSLAQRLRESPCEPFDSSMRIAIRRTRRYVYPDATIVCGPVEFDLDDPNLTTIINPRVVFEVLSRSTEGNDRGEKFRHYQHSPTVEEYVLIAQDRPRVEGLLRQADGTWNLTSWEGPDAVARVRCVGVDLPLAELYARVVFPPEQTTRIEPAEGGGRE